jgi:hypothetical protein
MVQAQFDRWSACSGGLVLLDAAGIVCAYDGKFGQLFAVPSQLPVPDTVIERIFPPGLRPRDLVLSATAGIHHEHGKVFRLAAAGNQAVLARLQLQRIGDWCILGIHLTDCDRQSPEPGFLDDQFATRRDIAAYLHDTVSQHLVALSFLLARLRRDPAIASAPDFVRTVALFDTCSRDLRVLSDALTPALSATGECSADEAISALQWYVEHLRDDAGLPVRFDAVGHSGASGSINPVFRAVLGATLQRWAEVAINHPHAGETHILLAQAAPGLVLQFLSSQSADPGIAAILSSSVLRESVRAAGGNLGTVTSHKGESACLTFPDIAVQIMKPLTDTSFND